MSREIKFRAWFVESQVMYSWDDLINHIGISSTTFLETELWKPMQYTGLKDKEGVEIYEGDIVEFIGEGGSVYEVVYDDDVAAFALHNWDTTSHTFFYELSQEDVLEVIGDIHQNPELLKEKE